MRERVVITGIGCVSPFGVGHDAMTAAVLAGTPGIRPITAFDTSTCRSKLGATIHGFDPAQFIAPLKLRRVDEVGRVALACARLVLDDAMWQIAAGGTDELGVALGTMTAGVDSTVEYLEGLAAHGPTGAPAILFSNTVSNAPASLCAIEFGLRGPNVTFNQREASSLAALVFCAGAIRDGRVPAMISGGVDRLESLSFRTHDRFHALTPRHAGQDEAARPFDLGRNGFVLGEGGFVVLLETADAAEQRGAFVYGEILGVGATASPTSVNGWPTEPSGVARAMNLALADAGLTESDVGAVFATANGATDLDRVEAEAIADVFGGRPVPVTSIKGAIGESGSAGGASVIAGLLAIARGVVPLTVGWHVADAACPVSVSAGARAADLPLFLVNSVAAGGTNYSILLRASERRSS